MLVPCVLSAGKVLSKLGEERCFCRKLKLSPFISKLERLIYQNSSKVKDMWFKKSEFVAKRLLISKVFQILALSYNLETYFSSESRAKLLVENLLQSSFILINPDELDGNTTISDTFNEQTLSRVVFFSFILLGLVNILPIYPSKFS